MATETHVPLTPGRIQAFRYDGRSRDIRWDASPNSAGSGFGVRIYPSGRKAYVLQYRPKEFSGTSKVVLRTIRSKRILKVLGSCDLMSLSEARNRGRELLEEIQIGIDPSEDRSLEGITLEDFLPIYLESKRQEGIAKKSLYDIERRVRNYLLPPFGDRPLTAIKRSHFHPLYLGIASGEKSISGNPAPVEANRLHAHLSNIYRVAEIRGAVPEGFSYPTTLIQKKREKPRKRFLSDPELKRLYSVLAVEPQNHALYVIQLLCLQGMRKEEILALRWRDVHLDRVSGRECEPPHIYVGMTKNDDRLFSVLSPQAVQIFEHLASQRSGSTAVFPSPVNMTQSVKDIRFHWRRIREKAGLGNFTLHDLRHCVGTWLDSLGYTELRIARVLNHRVKSVTQGYARTQNMKKEETMIALADWLEQTVGPPILKDIPWMLYQDT